MDQKNLTPDSVLKAIVLEVSTEKAVVLTDEGQFLSLRSKKGMNVGQSIFFFEEDVVLESQRASRKSPLNSFGIFASLAVAATILLFSFVAIMGRLDGPVAIISIDINPSLELGVSHKGLVKSLSALNEDGERIKMKIDYKGRTYFEVVQAVLNEAKKEGYDLRTRETIIGVGALNEESITYAESIAKDLSQLKVKNHWLVYMTPELVKQEKGHHESIGKRLHKLDSQNHKPIEKEQDDEQDDEDEENKIKSNLEDDGHESDDTGEIDIEDEDSDEDSENEAD